MELPNITPVEVAVFGAAIATFYVAPAFLAWGDARRQRRLERERVALEAAAAAVSVTPVDEPSPPLGVAEAVEGEAGVAATVAGETEDAAPTEQPLAVEPAYEPPSVGTGMPGEMGASAPAPIHIVLLVELRQVHLADWPPAEVRDDPARRQAWLEGERLAATDMARFGAVPLHSPVPVASACLASTGSDGAHRIFRYFLFSGLWPASAADAVADAEFQLDPTTGTVTGRVLPPSGR